jgi:hypothetical protein
MSFGTRSKKLKEGREEGGTMNDFLLKSEMSNDKMSNNFFVEVRNVERQNVKQFFVEVRNVERQNVEIQIVDFKMCAVYLPHLTELYIT